MVCLICCISHKKPTKLKRKKIDRLSIGLPQDFRHINHVGSGDTSMNTSMSSLTQRLQDVESDQGNVSLGISPLLLNCIDLTEKKYETSEHRNLTRNWVSVTDLPPPPVPPVLDDDDNQDLDFEL